MSWTWGRLKSVISSLDLPYGEWAVGMAGMTWMTDGHDRELPTVDLYVTPRVHDQLADRGWQRRDDDAVPVAIAAVPALEHPTEPGLTALAGTAQMPALMSVGQPAPLEELIRNAVTHDGLPVVRLEDLGLNPDREAVRREFMSRLPWFLRWGWKPFLGGMAIVLLLGWWLVGITTGDGGWGHFLGKTERIEATVVEVEETSGFLDDCKGSTSSSEPVRYRYTLSWELDGATAMGEFQVCESHSRSRSDEGPDFPVDATMTVWVTDDGEVASDQSPLERRLWVLLGPVVVLGFLGVAVWVARRRSGKRTRSAPAAPPA